VLSGLDMEIVGVNVEGCEALCLPCAAKRLGEPRCARVVAGLEDRREWGAPEVITRYTALDRALDQGYDCQCHEGEGAGIVRTPRGDLCERCCELCCHDCGKRLDEPPADTQRGE
jgi:hypothetical protein